MLTFKPITLDDIEIITPWFLHGNPTRLCDFTVGGTFFWRDLFSYSYAIDGDFLFFEMRIFEREIAYSLPLGGDREEAVRKLEAYVEKKGIPLIFAIVAKEEVDWVCARYPQAHVQPERDFFDYLYKTQDLLDLVGRRYRSIRNHISKFTRMYPDYKFDRIDESNKADAIAFIERYMADVGSNGIPSLIEEREKILEALEDLDRYRNFGGLLVVSGDIVGLSVGEIIGDTMYVHTEKAETDFAGSYQMLMHEFLKEFATDPEVIYVNREDDSGDPGLRRSKKSYNPIRFVEKYTIYTEGRPDWRKDQVTAPEDG